jgi:hypothetical protein
MIPETDDSELLKAAMLALDWKFCSQCAGPTQELRDWRVPQFWFYLCEDCRQFRYAFENASATTIVQGRIVDV